MRRGHGDSEGTLLAAERGTGYKVAVPISPAGLSWTGNPPLQQRLVSAVRKIEIPVFLIQPPKDASLEPSHVLGREFERLGKSYRGKIYPPEMPEDQQGHCFGGAEGTRSWREWLRDDGRLTGRSINSHRRRLCTDHAQCCGSGSP